MKTIAITLYRRPEQTRLLFEALNKCHGIRDYQIFIWCDYDDGEHKVACDKVWEQTLDFGAENWTVYPYKHSKLGIDLNKIGVLNRAFLEHEFVIFLEDDTHPAPDALRYFESMDRMFRSDPTVLSVSGYNRYTEPAEHERVLREERYALDRGVGFCPWGFATWRDRWEAVIGDGAAYKEKWGDEANGRHDFEWNDYAKAHEMYSVYPVLPRTNHGTWEDAEHTPSEEWWRENEFAPFGAWSQECPEPRTDQVWKEKW